MKEQEKEKLIIGREKKIWKKERQREYEGDGGTVEQRVCEREGL